MCAIVRNISISWFTSQILFFCKPLKVFSKINFKFSSAIFILWKLHNNSAHTQFIRILCFLRKLGKKKILIDTRPVGSFWLFLSWCRGGFQDFYSNLFSESIMTLLKLCIRRMTPAWHWFSVALNVSKAKHTLHWVYSVLNNAELINIFFFGWGGVCMSALKVPSFHKDLFAKQFFFQTCERFLFSLNGVNIRLESRKGTEKNT